MLRRFGRPLACTVVLSLILACACKRESPPPVRNGGTDAGGPPGAPALEDALVKKLGDAWTSRDPAYRPRTRHLEPDGSPTYTNRLFLETSPYLLQHAHNPVNWYPWGDEAFETAKRLKRPVLLSIGYSTCHWCHVMEEESFDDVEIARFMNENYIAIKVDREERPDVDAIYMQAVQMLTGRGGWPMTTWLEPSTRTPFYGGTYFPARDGDRGARYGFLTMLGKLKEVYDTQPDKIASSTKEIAQQIRSGLAPSGAGEDLPGPGVLRAAATEAKSGFDETWGGRDRAPKFPSGFPIQFFLRYHRRTGDEASLRMATLTLEKMAAGGMYDHVAGGFHRYSTDERWLVPHFEKMLYDNALLTVAYLEAWQVTGREDFARVARETLRYVGRDMTSPDGAFYSATDADSLTPAGEREEGWFFTWTPAELETVLGKERAKTVTAYYAVTPGGNFERRSILNTPRPLEAVAKELGTPAGELRREIDAARESLYVARAKRPPPLRDEKILTAWNGLMIGAFARGALVLGEPEYAKAAERAADFLLTRMRKDGRLFRSSKGGQPRHNAYLDDYAFLIAGLLDLYEATGNPRWFEEAISLDAVLEKHHEDKKDGGYFMTSDDHETLLAREKPAYDGAEPSGNSVQAMNLLRLQELTTDDRYRVRAERTFKAFSPRLTRSPTLLSEMLLAADFHLDTPKEVVIVVPSSRDEAAPFLAQLEKTFLPNRVLAIAIEGEDLARQAKQVPLLEGKVAQGGKPTAYVCERGICELPATDPAVFAQQIRKTDKLEPPAKSPVEGLVPKVH